MPPLRIRLLLVLLASFLPRTLPAEVWRVEADGSGDRSTIQAAIVAAATGDTISVGAGVHRERLTLEGKSLTFRGDGAESTVLDGEFRGRILTILPLRDPVVLEDLTFRNGLRTSHIEFPDDAGGAVAAFTAALHVRRCRFVNNRVNGLGGAIYATVAYLPRFPSPVSPGPDAILEIVDSTFEDNWAGAEGGAVFSDETDTVVRGSLFRGGDGTQGGGISTLGQDLRVSDCAFEDNVSPLDGGGIYAQANVVLEVVRTRFEDNRVDRRGGGAYVMGAEEAVFEECFFLENRAIEGGGVYARLSALRAHRVLWRGNQGSQNGGAIYAVDPVSTELTRCTWTGNQSASGASFSILRGAATVDASLLGDPVSNAFRCSSGSVGGGCNLAHPFAGGCAPILARREFTLCPGDPSTLCALVSEEGCGTIGHAEEACDDPACFSPVRTVTWGMLKSRHGFGP